MCIFGLNMLVRILLLIYLFGTISPLTLPDDSFDYRKATDYFSFSNKSIQSFFSKNEHKLVKWYDVVFILILISIFLLFLICVYYQRPLIDFIFSLFSKKKTMTMPTNERVILVHRKLPLQNVKSMYLTVPQPSYSYH